MIKIVLPDHPSVDSDAKTRGDLIAALDERVDGASVYDYKFTAEITHTSEVPPYKDGKPDGDFHCWDFDVYISEGILRVKLPRLSRTLSTKDMLLELMIADNGTATEWVRTLWGNPDAEGLWEAYRELTV
jgi:hypothetical protein